MMSIDDARKDHNIPPCLSRGMLLPWDSWRQLIYWGTSKIMSDLFVPHNDYSDIICVLCNAVIFAAPPDSFSTIRETEVECFFCNAKLKVKWNENDKPDTTSLIW